MPLYTQPNLSAGIDEVLISTSKSVSAFPIMILLFTFFAIWLGGSNNQKKRIGTADYPMWGVFAGITTSFMALIMTLGLGMINLTTLSIVFGATILLALWFFLSNAKGEV